MAGDSGTGARKLPRTGLKFQQQLLILASFVLFGFLMALLTLYLVLTGDADRLDSASAALENRLRGAKGMMLAVMDRAHRPHFGGKYVTDTTLQPRPPLGIGRAVVVVIAHDKPDELQRCLDSLFAQPDVGFFSLAVSLDHPPSFARMEPVVDGVKDKQAVSVWKKPEDPSLKGGAVAKIGAHFQFALRQAFEKSGYEFAILVETDLVLSPDFLWYFRITAPLLQEDPSLWCVSAWNDNGFKDLVSNETNLFRTDYFPGLGWMMRNDTWASIRGIWPRFPSTGWDHWIRHGSGLRSRDCIAPEVPRTKHVDEKGTNVKAGSAISKLLAKMATSSLPSGVLGNVSYLLKKPYEENLHKKIFGAPLISDIFALDSFRSKPIPGVPQRYFMMPYERETYSHLAKKLHLYPSQPRASRKGVILTKIPWSGTLLALVDRRQGHGLLPPEEIWKTRKGLEVIKALPGESCENACGKLMKRCLPRELEFLNNCETMKRYFPCEAGCGHQVGQEIPCYVHDKTRDTAGQCLVTDEAVPSCDAKFPSTTRICPCLVPFVAK